MLLSEDEKRRVIDLHFNQGKTIREVSRLMGKSSHDITPVTKEHKMQLAQNYALANGEQSDVVRCKQNKVIPNVKAYKLFDEGKNPLDVAAELNLPGYNSLVRILEMGERILYNLQKAMVDSTISTAAGLDEGNSYPAARRALPYYESPSQPPDQGERDRKETNIFFPVC